MELWKENKGSYLLVFAFLVFLVGSSILLYRQNRFVPPRFPDGDSIATIEETEPIADPENSIALGIAGAGTDFGKMRIAVYDSAESFNDLPRALNRYSTNVEDGQTAILIPVKSLPNKFAIAVFHDENSNGILDRNQLGIPSERYGFSNDSRGMTGPPTFEEALMYRPEPGQGITISIR